MTATLIPDAPAAEADDATPARASGFRLSMRWKLLIAFGLGFTVVFLVVAGWILRFSTDTANDRVRDTLAGLAVGGAATIDAEAFEALATMDLEPEIGVAYPANAGILAGTVATEESTFPTDPAYWAHVEELVEIRLVDLDSAPYSFAADAAGTVQFIGSSGAVGYPRIGIDEPLGGGFRQDVTEIIDEVTLGFFEAGLTETTEQLDAYSDGTGDWISVYSPIVDPADGDIVGALGVDYPLSYVEEVRSDVLRVLYPVFGVSYLVLLGLVFYLSGWFTRRLSRLSSATKRVADGDYDVDVSDAARAVFPDEMTELADSFAVMTEKVGSRERTLVQQVQILKVEIDEQKRQAAVAEIVDSDFFSDLTAKAADIRKKVKDLEEQERLDG